MLNLDPLAPDRIRPLQRVEYERIVEVGLFEGERVELLRGALVSMGPQGAGHAEVVTRLTEALVVALRGRARVRTQCPFAASDDSEPEPDVAVVPVADHSRAHPAAAHLVVEVAQTSLRKDRLIKAGIYAANGVPEYWVVDLEGRRIEVHTEPADGRYREVVAQACGCAIALTAFPDVRVTVDAVLPAVATPEE